MLADGKPRRAGGGAGDQMINIAPVFINFIANDLLKLDNAQLEKYCLDLKKNSAGRIVSNGGGWQSNYLDLRTPALQQLLEEVDKRLNEVHRHFNFNDAMRQVITETWVNVNNRGHFNYGHNHPGSMFSCVYYVKGGAAKGNIEFVTPIAEHSYTISDTMVANFNAFTGNALSLPPVTGELLIFPAWLVHRVRQNEIDDDRISIALNSGVMAIPSR